MASRIISNCCAVCGRRTGRSSFQFVLLAEACRFEGMQKLKVPQSNYFHERCARKAMDALKKVSLADLSDRASSEEEQT
jgi:hypothetical protein